MAFNVAPSSMPNSLSYASAVKQLTFSQVSHSDKIKICRSLLSLQYYPDPSTAVLDFLCSVIAKGAAAVEDCYTIRNSDSIPEHALQDWNLLIHAMRRYFQTFFDHYDHREAPLIPSPVLVQGGLHLLRGSCALQATVAEALHLILKRARYSQDLETHTWLFCAFVRAEGPSSVMEPLRTMILPRLSLLISLELDKDSVAAAVVSVLSQAVPSCLASQLESTVVDSIRASPDTFHDRFRMWVLQSEAALPYAIQFLLRAYAKHPPKTNGEHSSKKRGLWEPARRDALEFFDALTGHMLHTLRVKGDQTLCGGQEFLCRMRAIQTLCRIGSQSAVYLPLRDQSPHQGTKRKRSRNHANGQCAATERLHGLLLELIQIARSQHLDAEVNNERVKCTFQTICEIARFSFDAIDELLQDVLALCLTSKEHLRDPSVDNSNRCELFCTLVLRYEKAQALSKFLSQLMKTLSPHSLIAILRQKSVQVVLGTAFSSLRGVEAQACVESLMPASRSQRWELSALALISSLLLETIATPCISLTAKTVADRVVGSLLRHPVKSEIGHESGQCRLHLLSSFIIAITSNDILSMEEDIRVAMLRLVLLSDTQIREQEKIPLESILLEALSAGPESKNAPELCAKLRCLTSLAHYSYQYRESSDCREFVTRVVQIALVQFDILNDMLKKANASKSDDSLSNILYGSVGFGLVLPWLGSLGNLLARFSFTATGKGEVISFFSHALRFFPTTHPVWDELSEERKWSPVVMKASCVVLKRLSQSPECASVSRSCALSQALASISTMPPSFFVGPDQRKLLHNVLQCMTNPCCPESHQAALSAANNVGDTSDLHEVLLTVFRKEEHDSIQKTNHRLDNLPSKRRRASPFMRIIVAMRVIALQGPKKQVSLLSHALSALLRTAILGLKLAFETEFQLHEYPLGTWYEAVGALLDLRTSLESAKDIGTASNGMSTVEEAVNECVKVALPLCVKSFCKDSTKKLYHCEETEHLLSAMVKGTSPIYRKIFSDRECGFLLDAMTKAYMPYGLHSLSQNEDLVSLFFVKLPILQGSSRQSICQVLLSLLDRALKKVRHHLPSTLRGDADRAAEAISKLILVATHLTTSCTRLCDSSRYALIEASERDNEDVRIRLRPHADANWRYNASTRILSGLEAFLRIWNCATQELTLRQVAELQESALLSYSDALASSSMEASLEVVVASRSLSRGDMEKLLLLTREVVERVCACKVLLRNESGILVNALQICRVAVRRYSGLVQSASQMIAVLLRRGINTENTVIIAAVREAIEEICNNSKTWEVLSALLADCSTTLNETTESNSRHEAEKSTAILFKAVGERRAQQILVCLSDTGRESLKQIWEMFSNNLYYSGK